MKGDKLNYRDVFFFISIAVIMHASQKHEDDMLAIIGIALFLTAWIWGQGKG